MLCGSPLRVSGHACLLTIKRVCLCIRQTTIRMSIKLTNTKLINLVHITLVKV
ncbi:hypothetical protein IV72_GL000816 [Atopobium minutum]|nr:hypothetical protein IV72_GL000816 [Atopobium minutum]